MATFKQGSIEKAFQIIKSTISTIGRLGYKTPKHSFPKPVKYVRYLSLEEESKLLKELKLLKEIDPNGRTWSLAGDVERERHKREEQ